MRSWLVSLPFWIYRIAVSPALHLFSGPGLGCRFQPTCSEYALEAVQKQGLWKGTLLTLSRLCRCHPFSQCDIDGSSRKVSPNGS